MGNGIGITEYLEAGMRAAGLRGQVIASNLANLDTPGYRRGAVAFEDVLADALGSGREVDVSAIVPQIVRPMSTAVDAAGNDVDLDTEVGEMVKNSARYKTYVRLLGKMYRQMDLAMRME